MNFLKKVGYTSHTARKNIYASKKLCGTGWIDIEICQRFDEYERSD
jgi:hypothetical protein